MEENDTVEKEVTFIPPDQGTPAAIALAANAALKVSKATKGFHKLRGLKRPKMKTLNVVKQLNKHTKRKRKRHFSKNIKGKVIDGVHELYTLTAGMILGMRVAMGRHPLGKEQLSPDDFTYVERITFPAAGNNTPPHITPPHSLIHTFKFKSYAPQVFKQIRDAFDIDTRQYCQSVCGNYNFLEFISNSKSGQFFFYSHDGKYMIKTQTKEENKFMLKILPEYHAYINANPHTMLCRIYAMYRVKMYHLRRKVHFVIMGSVFDTPEEIHTIYDLKGSLIGRRSSEKDRESGGVLKDQDLIDDKRKFTLGSKKEAFMAQVVSDAKFLAKLNIMDYSLLVGIHDRSRRPEVPFDAAEVMEPTQGYSMTDLTESGGAMEGPNNFEVVAAAAVDNGAGVNVTTSGSSAGVIHGSNTPFRRSMAIQSGNMESFQQQLNAQTTPLPPTMTMEGLSIDTTTTTGVVMPPAPPGSTTTPTGSSTPVKRSSSKKSSGLSKSSSPVAAASNVVASSIDHFEKDVEEEYESVESVDSDDDSEEEDKDQFDSNASDGDGYYSDEGDSDVEEACDQEVAGTLPATSDSGSQNTTGDSRLTPPALSLLPCSQSTDSLLVMDQSMYSSPSPMNVAGMTTCRAHPWTARADGGINSRSAAGKRESDIYFIGIIDILQQYNASKQVENFVKGFTSDNTQISAVDSERYAERFIKFMDQSIE